MSDASNNMPARIWVDEVGGDFPAAYYRADIVERMAGAVSETLAKFDACRDSAVRNTPLGLTKLRSALNSYREASNEKA